MTELVNQSLRPLRFPHDSFPVILPDGPRKLVIVHRRTVFTDSPKACHPNAIFDFEHASALIQPPDTWTMLLPGGQQLLQELPEMNMRTIFSSTRFLCGTSYYSRRRRRRRRCSPRHGFVVFIIVLIVIYGIKQNKQ